MGVLAALAPLDASKPIASFAAIVAVRAANLYHFLAHFCEFLIGAFTCSPTCERKCCMGRVIALVPMVVIGAFAAAAAGQDAARWKYRVVTYHELHRVASAHRHHRIADVGCNGGVVGGF